MRIPQTSYFIFGSRTRQSAMTLVELLVAMAIFSVMITVLFSILVSSQKAWSHARDQLRQFQESRVAFEILSRRITDSVLNPYWGYEFPDGDTSLSPLGFTRQSELHFVSGPVDDLAIPNPTAPGHAIFFHGPFGLHDESNWTEFNSLLNGWGYYVDYNTDEEDVPSFFSSAATPRPPRFRLMEMRIPSDQLSTYQLSTTDPNEWYKQGILDAHTTVVAENVIALIVSPKAPEGLLGDPTEIAPDYIYDTRAHLGATTTSDYATDRSRNQLPPLLQITMVVIDESSAIRLDDQAGEDATAPDFGLGSLFQTATDFDTDMATFQENLVNAGMRFRVFSSVVRLRNARWSETPIPSQ